MFLQTKNHNWAIYVNPVGVDATVKTKEHRCGAGGYIWNPYYTQLADPLNVKFFTFINIKNKCSKLYLILIN